MKDQKSRRYLLWLLCSLVTIGIILTFVCGHWDRLFTKVLEDAADTALTFTPLRRAEHVSEELVNMIPTQAEFEGSHGGYIFIPIDGEIYRYQSSSTQINNFTTDELIYEFTEYNEWGDSTDWKMYSLKEYPEYDVILGEREVFGGMLFSYAPAKGVSESDIDDAIENGFVMMKNGSVFWGKELWLEFYEKTQAGQPCSIRLGYCYTGENENMVDDLREATKEDYPSLYLKELRFDGSQFVSSPVNKIDDEYVIYEIPGIDSPEKTFSYLMHYSGDSQSDYTTYKTYDKYVLTNDNTVTLEDIGRSILSSNFSSYIEFQDVFCEYE